METYLIEPLLGIGPVRLEMSREEVRQAMPLPPHSFRKTPHSQHETDAFHQSAFQVFYTGEMPTVEYIELSGGGELRALFAGQSMFETPATELVAILGQQYAQQNDDDAAPCDVLFPDLELSLWRPSAPESSDTEEGQYFATVGIGVLGITLLGPDSVLPPTAGAFAHFSSFPSSGLGTHRARKLQLPVPRSSTLPAVAKPCVPHHAPGLLNDSSKVPTIFFDRDGTLMEDTDYCRDPAQVRVYPDAAPALIRLRAAGFRLVLVTNQSGLGRGYFTEADYHAVHTEFVRQLAPATLDAAHFCSDAPSTPSTHRKPAPGMIHDAARDLGLDLARSYMIGDKAADIELAVNAGLRGSILVLTGKGQAEQNLCHPDFIAPDLATAADWILSLKP